MVKRNNQKGQSNNKCPNCEKDITLEQIKAICVSKKNRKGKRSQKRGYRN